MYHYQYSVLIREKQKEVEKISNEAWKYADFKQESLLKKAFRKFSVKKMGEQQNSVFISECC